MLNKNCHCGSNSHYADCCEPFILKIAKPKSPEQLMRSRYSAFVEKNAEYLVDTLHVSKRTHLVHQELQKSFEITHWHSLRILHSSHKTSTGQVEFAAFYSSNSENLGQLHELSRFVLENDQWFYLQGEQLPSIKIGRNDPCWCGSTKKIQTLPWKALMGLASGTTTRLRSHKFHIKTLIWHPSHFTNLIYKNLLL